MNDAISVHDIETGLVVDVNRKMCEMYGYTREETFRLLDRRGECGQGRRFAERAAQFIRWLQKANHSYSSGMPKLRMGDHFGWK